MKKQASKQVPLVVIEEHNEAFYVWNWAIKKGITPSLGNSLLHVDEHSDMSSGRFNIRLEDQFGNLFKIKQFTERELSIDTFISAAIYSGIVDNVIWVKQKHEGGMIGEPVRMYVRSYNNMAKRLIIGRAVNQDLHDEVDKEVDIKYFNYQRAHVDGIEKQDNQLLDIDLDFFSCVGNPSKQKEIIIQITEEEFNSFSENTYHRLNYVFSRVEVAKERDKHYYVINGYEEIYAESTYVSEEEIRERVNFFSRELKRKQVEPTIITLCRSRFSGFTPQDQWRFIENELIGKLAQIYSIELIDYSQI